MSLSLFSAFLAGLLGSLHCVGMCGGIVGGLSIGAPPARLPLYLLVYNLGRVLSYSCAGVLAGFLGAHFLQHLPTAHAGELARGLSGVFMILLGLYIADWWRVLLWLERGGARLWRYLEPLGRKCLPVRSVSQAFGLGLVWGWLPCGLVYSVLVFALSSGSAWRGGALMVAFGIGTLPMLLALGGAAHRLLILAKTPQLRRIAGAFLMVAGLYSLFGPR